jgi:hypothetical protein
MAYEIANYAVKITGVAAADLSAKQYYFVKFNGSNGIVVCSGATDRPIGVLQNAPLSGQEAEILVAGGTKVAVGGTIGDGGAIKTDANGKAVALTVGTDTTHYLVGTALADAASGEIGTIVVACASAGRGA